MKRIYINILLLVLQVFPSVSQTVDREYKIKAAFLFNFTQFVEWPPAVLPEANTPVVIGVLGENPFGSYLGNLISGEQVNGHPIVMQQYKNVEEIKICHILFINETEINKLKQAITTLKGQSILTVSDAPDFIEEGGMVRFVKRNNKLRIQINPLPVKEAGIIISSKLLSVAEIIKKS